MSPGPVRMNEPRVDEVRLTGTHGAGAQTCEKGNIGNEALL